MKVLALPNAFKGTISARYAARILTQDLSPRHTVRAWPISDGGDGFLDFFRTLDPHAQPIALAAPDAFLNKRGTSFLMLSDGKTAAVETARVCGLGRIPKNQLDPLGASSYGVGQVLRGAVKHGAKTIYVGLGGVACNDGGAGMAAACGAKLLDKNGGEIAPGAKGLLSLSHLDLSTLREWFDGVKVIGVCDVTNPLLGPLGSARVFGPQKGATPTQVKQLEKALTVWADVLEKTTGKSIATIPGSGAAGAIGAGLYGCYNAELCPGTDLLFRKAQIEKQIQWADLVITGEGKLDAQTFYGKAPGIVLQLARKHKKPVLFICGQLDKKNIPPDLLPPQIIVLADVAKGTEAAQKYTVKYLRQACQNI